MSIGSCPQKVKPRRAKVVRQQMARWCEIFEAFDRLMESLRSGAMPEDMARSIRDRLSDLECAVFDARPKFRN